MQHLIAGSESDNVNALRIFVKVSLFIPCFVDQLFPQVGIATANILKSLNCSLVYPEQQTCCGQPAFNSGYSDEATRLAERFIEIFHDAEYVVAPSGSCVAMARNLFGELDLSQPIRNEWKNLRRRIYEVTDFLTSVLNIDQWEGSFAAKVTYHDGCHALRELGIRAQPRKLLRSIGGLELMEMKNADTCCGFGGTFAVKFADISTAMVQQKVNWIQESNAEVVVSTDSSCLMNIAGFMERHKIPIKTMHIAEVLWQALQNNGGEAREWFGQASEPL